MGLDDFREHRCNSIIAIRLYTMLKAHVVVTYQRSHLIIRYVFPVMSLLSALRHMREGERGRLKPPVRFMYCLYSIFFGLLTA